MQIIKIVLGNLKYNLNITINLLSKCSSKSRAVLLHYIADATKYVNYELSNYK